MSDEPVVPETQVVTAELMAPVDLGPEIEGMAGRELRLRMFTFAPGAVFGPLHDHKDRPAIGLRPAGHDHRPSRCRLARGLHSPENRGTVPAVEIAVDVVRQK